MKKPKRLKTLPQYFEEIIKGNKRAELRFNDRDFKVGDIYELEEYDGKTYTGRSVTVRITHILEGFEGLANGWCMFSFVTLGEAKESCLNKIEETAKETNKPPKDAKYGELLRLIAENPSLPVVPMVYSEVVQDDGYSSWVGAFGDARVGEYVLIEKYGENRYFERDDQDEIEEYFVDKYCDEAGCEYNPQLSEIAHEKAEALPWKKAILVYIDLPEVDDE